MSAENCPTADTMMRRSGPLSQCVTCPILWTNDNTEMKPGNAQRGVCVLSSQLTYIHLWALSKPLFFPVWLCSHTMEAAGLQTWPTNPKRCPHFLPNITIHPIQFVFDALVSVSCVNIVMIKLVTAATNLQKRPSLLFIRGCSCSITLYLLFQ